MKKRNIIIASIIALFSISISCKDKSSKTEVASEEHNLRPNGHPHEGNKDRKGPPGGGERKGPPGGKGPMQTKTIEEIGGYNIGDVAIDFNLKSVDGTMVSLAGIENAKGYIVTFTCNECPFAKLYEDRLIEINDKYASKGYPVIAINPNSPENKAEGYEAMQARAKEKAFTFPYLVDEGQKIYPQYGAVRTPHVFLLDNERKVQYIGSVDDNAHSPEKVNTKYLEDAIEALENNKKPNPNITKAIGCPIKANRA